MSLVSIIIPIYNVEKFIDDTIQSVINQSYMNWELILVDDGSQDTSVENCRKYLEDERISLFLQENKGVSVARNYGLSFAKGKYVYFLDSDDTIDVDFIKTSVEVAEQNDSDIVVVGDYFERRFPNVCALPTCAMFLKNNFLQKYSDIRFPEGIQPCEDGLFSHQLLALTDKVGFNPNGIYHYRKHNEQNTANLNYNDILEKIPIWFDILEFFYNKNDFIKKKYLHLLRFIQHEPFGARYFKSNLTEGQKKQLFKLIHYFCKKNIFPFWKVSDKEKLHPIFVKFLESENHYEFDMFLEKHLSKLEKRRKFRIKIAEIFFYGKNREQKINRINRFFEIYLDL